MSLRGVFGSIVLAVAVTTSSTSWASPPTAVDKANARRLFNEGLDLRQAEDHAGAVGKLAAADALFPTPKTRYELGREQLANGRLVEAHSTWLSVENVVAPAGEESKYVALRREAARLASDLLPRIPNLRLPSAPGLVVELDRVVIPQAALTEPRMVDPGNHTVVLKMAGKADRVVEVVLREGETREVDAPSEREERPTTEPPSRARTTTPMTKPSPWSTQRSVAVGLAGVSAVALGVTAYLALSARSTFDAAAPNCPGPGNACDATGVALREDAYATANVATFVGVGAIAAAAGAGILWFTAPSGTSTNVGLASNGLVVRGSFR
jgi:hypothetical protein